MITVTILINGNPIYTRSAVNRRTVAQTKGLTLCEYELDDGTKLQHHREDGAIQLAKDMLDTIKELR